MIAPLSRERLLGLDRMSLVENTGNRPLRLRCRTPRRGWTTKRPGDRSIAGAHFLLGGCSFYAVESFRKPVSSLTSRKQETHILYCWCVFDGGSNSSPAATVLSVCDSFIVNISGLYSKAFGPPRVF